MVWSEASMGWLRVCPTRFEDSLIPWRSLSWSMRRQTSQRKSDRLSAPNLTHLGQVTFSALGQDRRKRTRNFNCSTRQVWLLSNHISCLMSAAAAAKSLQSCRTLCDPRDGSPPGSPSLGFSRQEHWSRLPFPSPMHGSESEVTQGIKNWNSIVSREVEIWACWPPWFKPMGEKQQVKGAKWFRWVVCNFEKLQNPCLHYIRNTSALPWPLLLLISHSSSYHWQSVKERLRGVQFIVLEN